MSYSQAMNNWYEKNDDGTYCNCVAYTVYILYVHKSIQKSKYLQMEQAWNSFQVETARNDDYKCQFHNVP